MTTLTITNNFSVEIELTDSIVFVSTFYFGDKKTYSYADKNDCIENTTIKAVKNYLLQS